MTRLQPLKRAFTLIELLVVIAIICLLVAILFPVFESARDKARAATCMSNLKQIGGAMIQYTDDYDSLYPAEDGCYGNGTTPLPVAGVPSTATQCKGSGQALNGPAYGDRLNMYKWWWWLYPYTKSLGVFFCPSRPVVNEQSSAASDWTGSAEIDTGYALNTSITGALNTYGNCDNGPTDSVPPCGNTGAFRSSFLAMSLYQGGPSKGVSQTFIPNITTNVPEPDKTLLFTEMSLTNVTSYLVNPYYGSAETMIDFPAADKAYWNKIFHDDLYGTTGADDRASTNAIDPTAAPHQGGVEVAYCDGHVKWLSVDEFLANCPPVEKYIAYGSKYPAASFYIGMSSPDAVSSTSHSYTVSLGSTGQDWPMWALYRSRYP